MVANYLEFNVWKRNGIDSCALRRALLEQLPSLHALFLFGLVALVERLGSQAQVSANQPGRVLVHIVPDAFQAQTFVLGKRPVGSPPSVGSVGLITHQ